MKLVIIESPFSGDTKRNKKYLRECIIDCLRRGEAPFASHLMYTDALDDTDPAQRELGISAGFCWAAIADLRVVYEDFGISSGMKLGILHAESLGQPVEFRRLR